jgi:hypothetical protein
MYNVSCCFPLTAEPSPHYTVFVCKFIGTFSLGLICDPESCAISCRIMIHTILILHQTSHVQYHGNIRIILFSKLKGPVRA